MQSVLNPTKEYSSNLPSINFKYGYYIVFDNLDKIIESAPLY